MYSYLYLKKACVYKSDPQIDLLTLKMTLDHSNNIRNVLSNENHVQMTHYNFSYLYLLKIFFFFILTIKLTFWPWKWFSIIKIIV